MKRFSLAVVLGLAAACGGGGGDDVDGGGTASCGFAGDAWLPQEVGYRWEYRVTDLNSGEVTVKPQVIETEMNHPDDGMPVLVQVTGKDNGKTVNWIRTTDTQVYRLQQEDYDAQDVLERTTAYDPKKIRLDWGAWLDEGTMTESYSEIQTEAGVTEPAVAVTEEWVVLGTDVPCESALGTFSCLHLRRTRTEGGIADKQYWYARGIGKVREEGGQIEVLQSCGVN